MELKQLQSFCAVVQYRSFTRAAEKLYLSQPTVSTHIRQLEEEFGSRLIVRTTKSIEVTPRGQELYACACGIVHLRDDLLRSWSDEDEKVIRIGASTIPSAYILPQILPAFRREHPAPQFHVFQSRLLVRGSALSGDHHMLPHIVQGRSQLFLTVGIHIRRIEIIDSGLIGPADQLHRVSFGDTLNRQRADGGSRHIQIRAAQSDFSHAASLL